jgi:hypothetical protein
VHSEGYRGSCNRSEVDLDHTLDLARVVATAGNALEAQHMECSRARGVAIVAQNRHLLVAILLGQGALRNFRVQLRPDRR